MSVINASSSANQIRSFAEVISVQGASSVNLTSNKDNILVPTNSDGSNPVYTNASVIFSVYEGNTNSTATWTFSIVASSATTSSLNVNSQTVSVTSLTADVGSFTVRATKPGYSPLYKQVNVYRAKKGVDTLPSDTSVTYIAFADDISGRGYTTSYSQDKEFYAILFSSSPIPTLDVDNFVGLWRPINQYPETANYDKVAFMHTSYCHWNLNGMAYASMTPGAYHYKGAHNRIYFALMDYHLDAGGSTRGVGHTSNSTQIGFYDLDTKCFSPMVTIPNIKDTSTDQHDIPTIIVSDDGHILVIKEQLVGSPGTHNSPIEIWRSNHIEEIALTATPTIHDFTLLPLIGTAFAYPNVVLGPNIGELFLFLRYNAGEDHGHLYVTKSEDDGSTWGTPYEVARCTHILQPTELDWYWYPRVCLGKRENGICIATSINEGPDNPHIPSSHTTLSSDGSLASSRYKIDAYLFSRDGITFGNVQYQFGNTGSFSKNVVTGGYLTPTEIYGHFVFKDVSSPADVHHSIDILDSAIDSTGIPYIFVREWSRWSTYDAGPDYSTKDNLIYADLLYHYDLTNNIWVGVDITGVALENYEALVADSNRSSVRGSRCLINVYENGVIDYVTRRILVKDDFYKLPYATIDSSTEALRGGIFKITTASGTPTDNFGEGLVAGDYYVYGATTPTFNANNTLTPLEEEIVFYRSYNKGESWTEIREPLYIRGFNYATNLPITTSINNNQQGGITGVFLGLPKPVAAGTAYDHSDICFVWDQVRV